MNRREFVALAAGAAVIAASPLSAARPPLELYAAHWSDNPLVTPEEDASAHLAVRRALKRRGIPDASYGWTWETKGPNPMSKHGEYFHCLQAAVAQ